MLYSMTGYGSANSVSTDKTITVELRSVNSKFVDMRFKMPSNYRDKESIVRRMVLETIDRGKVDFSLTIREDEADSEFKINEGLFKKYFRDLSKISLNLDIDKGDIVQTIMRIPNVVYSDDSTVTEEEWSEVSNTILLAIVEFNKFRLEEGSAMERDITNRIETIASLLLQISPYEDLRLEHHKLRLRQLMSEHVDGSHLDNNRFEQEILYYLDKIDINEEKVRLTQHCKYFLEEMHSKQVIKGRKLGFITQEIGREINTLGSKAYSADIQKLVVQMKDELEKVKEQIANIV